MFNYISGSKHRALKQSRRMKLNSLCTPHFSRVMVVSMNQREDLKRLKKICPSCSTGYIMEDDLLASALFGGMAASRETEDAAKMHSPESTERWSKAFLPFHSYNPV
ncbi:hypothetical protein Q8A73_013070 [Channa argus]|nr:hypothetical protein Q8A73_013070 [Channa argus]